MKQMQKRTCMGIVLLILTLTMTACSTETELQKSQIHGLKDKNNPFVILRWYHYASHRLKGNIRL